MSVEAIQNAGRSIDERVRLSNVPWSVYEALDRARGERANPRLTYLDGELELMSPSFDHNRIASFIGRLLECYALESGIDFTPAGNWTLKAKEAGAEPDECYVIGEQRKELPDLAIEVVWTSGGIDKLEIYRKLGVPEVWYWRDGRIEVYLLRKSGYVRAPHSKLFRGLDLALLTKFLDRPTATQAIRAYREALQASAKKRR